MSNNYSPFSPSMPTAAAKTSANVFLLSNNINSSLAKTKTDLQKIESIQRNLLSQSSIQTPKRSTQSSEHAIVSKSTAEISKTAALDFTSSSRFKANSSSTTAGGATQPVQSEKAPVPTKTKSPPALTNLELKPATVEVYFRSSSGKSQKIEKKAIPTTIFPPPKINLKA